MVAMSSSVCIRQCSGLGHDRHSRFVPWLVTCEGDDSSHICSSRGSWIGHWYVQKMLERMLW